MFCHDYAPEQQKLCNMVMEPKFKSTYVSIFNSKNNYVVSTTLPNSQIH